MKLLLIEDDNATADYVRQGLIELGHACDHSETGIDGLTAALTNSYDAIILDRSLPQLDGLSVLQALRAEGRTVPVLILSALGQVDDRIRGLDSGADDYLPKPFSFQELIARLSAIIRRSEGVASTTVVRQVADVNRRSIGTPYRRAKGTPLLRCWVVDAGRGFRAAGGVGRA